METHKIRRCRIKLITQATWYCGFVDLLSSRNKIDSSLEIRSRGRPFD
jgi:hypothetical protein